MPIAQTIAAQQQRKLQNAAGAKKIGSALTPAGTVKPSAGGGGPIAALLASLLAPPKQLGPNLGKVIGTNAGGILGTGIRPSDAIATLIGALLTQNLPQDQAIGRTLQIGGLPSKARGIARSRKTGAVGIAGTLSTIQKNKAAQAAAAAKAKTTQQAMQRHGLPGVGPGNVGGTKGAQSGQSTVGTTGPAATGVTPTPAVGGAAPAAGGGAPAPGGVFNQQTFTPTISPTNNSVVYKSKTDDVDIKTVNIEDPNDPTQTIVQMIARNKVTGVEEKKIIGIDVNKKEGRKK